MAVVCKIDDNGNITRSAHKNDGVIQKIELLQTINATPTDIATVAVSEGEAYYVEAKIVGRKSDGTERAIYKLIGSFYRNTAGNVTKEGITQKIPLIESNSAWDANLVADTGNQTVDVRVTGEAAANVDWKCALEYFHQ